MKGIVCPVFHGHIDELKTSSLFVDVLVPANVAQHGKKRGIFPGTDDILDEISHLEHLGILEIIDLTENEESILEFGENFDHTKLTTYGWPNYPPMGVKIFDFFDMQASDHSYLVSESLNFISPNSAVSLHTLPKAFSSSNDLTTSDVINLVVNEIPVPDHRMPWTEIANLKKEEEFNNRLRLLRNWLRSTVKDFISVDAVLDDIRTQIYEYERYMKGAAIKCDATPVDFAITIAPGVLEDILKLNLESLSNRLLKVRKSRARLVLEELQAPGRAISIVPYINSNFRA